MVPDGPGSSIDVREFHKVFRILIMDGLNCTWKKMGHCLFAVEAIAIHPVPEVSCFLSLTDKMDSLNPGLESNRANRTEGPLGLGSVACMLGSACSVA